MSVWRSFFVCIVAVLLANGAVAQEQPPSREPTLPGVEVTPPEEAPTLDDVEVTEPADESQSYPSLVDQVFGDGFGGDTGILRGPQSLFDTPAAASIRSRQEIAERQAPDMFQALQNEVGILMQSTAAGQTSPFIRGLTGEQILLLIDGIRLNNSTYRRGPNQYFNTIDPGMVDHIEVLRGQGSVLWGSDAIGGVINVVTRSPDLARAACCGDFFGQEFTEYYNTSDSGSYSRLNVEGAVGSAGVFAGGSFYNPRDLDTGFDEFPRQPGTNYQQYAGDVKFNYLLSDCQMLTFALQHFEQENVPRSDRYPGFPLDRGSLNSASGARFFDPQQRDLAYIRYQSLGALGGNLDALTLTASYHRQREIQTRTLTATPRFQETDVETTGLSAVATKELGCSATVKTGVDWYYDDVDSPFGGAAGGPIIPDDAWYAQFGWFLNCEAELTDRINASAGVRYVYVETAGTPEVMGMAVPINPSFDGWVGQLGLVYELTPEVNLVGSISEGFRAPNLDDLMANNPNVLQQGMSLPSLGLTPEHTLAYEVGIKTDFDRLRTETYVFWMDLQDKIVSITAAPNTFASANQDSYIQGIEFKGEYLLPQDGWSVYGNFWYLYGKNVVTGDPFSRIPPMQGILGLRWRQPELHSYFDIYTWMSDRQNRLDTVRDVTDERIPIGGTPGFATLNARYGRAFGYCDQHRVSVSLENITDQPYQVHASGVLGTGFTARLGYSFTH